MFAFIKDIQLPMYRNVIIYDAIAATHPYGNDGVQFHL